MHRFIRFMALMFVLASAVTMTRRLAFSPGETPRHGVEPAMFHPSTAPVQPTNWFEGIKPYCNSVEVVTRMRYDVPPADVESQAYAAACYALAARTDSARAVLLRLAPNDQRQAAGIVFEVGHPVADMGDDKSAGPIMELVVEFLPDHYMALYHAGASEFQLGQFELAKQHLTSFLKVYPPSDGWTSSARGMLERIEKTAAPSFKPVEAPRP